ncbi:MAG TPA: rhomboid family intramembrane serine protease [Bacteroidia bacterium]|jgi:membrane associated rhomboid family serine protease|nr:rhomboid family intramembrane serine protease [Bacteroidia bacterium]
MITLIIVVITVGVSLYAMDNYSVKNRLMFNAYQIRHRKEWYRFFSSGLIHADYMHLGFNMLTLYGFGKNVEALYDYYFNEKGILFFILLYVGGLAMSSLYSYEKHKNDIHYNALGASGAVSSVLFACILMMPTNEIYIFFAIPMPAYIFGIIFLGVEYYLGKRGQSNIGHDAHFWGAIFGIVFTLVLKPELGTLFFKQIFG